jgi:DNA-binding transcriptional LysR family regulator
MIAVGRPDNSNHAHQTYAKNGGMMDLIASLTTFLSVVETGSLTAAARRLASSQSAVTRQLAQLEDHFGVRLLHRTTRRLSLTNDGEDLLAHARHLLETAQEMEVALGRHRRAPAGQVRFATPGAFGLFLAGRLPLLLDRNPELSVELLMMNRVGNMVEERLDLAAIVGEVADSSLVVRSVGHVALVAVASRDYLERHGAPERPEQLTGHQCIVGNVGSSGHATWRFEGPDGPVSVALRGRFSSNSSRAIRLSALAGFGVALLAEFEAADELRDGRLVRLFPNYTAERIPVVLAYPSRRNLAPRTRTVLEFAVAQVEALRRELDRRI